MKNIPDEGGAASYFIHCKSPSIILIDRQREVWNVCSNDFSTTAETFFKSNVKLHILILQIKDCGGKYFNFINFDTKQSVIWSYEWSLIWWWILGVFI